ncbi:MAG TPA: O-antigen ligase family protein [Candidatus Dormibacteraeota bacterium]|jgi:hypothetical protein|nr:O-antigen ligase family protein [Candidatus Dormibacteraeota bacterium]
MTALEAVLTVAACVVLLGLFALGVRRPIVALAVLLFGLAFHSLVIVLAREWIGEGNPPLVTLGLWKEAIVAGLAAPLARSAVAAVRRVTLGPRRWTGQAFRTSVSAAVRDSDGSLSMWLIVLLLGLLVLEVPVSIARGNPVSAVVLDWRGLAVPFIALLAVRGRRIRVDDALLAVRAAVVAGGAVALFSYFQVLVLGFGFLNTFYRDPGAPLSTAYRVSVSAVKTPRAIGGHIGPNEFGLFLVVLLAGYLILLLRRPASPAARRIQVASGYAMVIALVITYSRSAWVAAGIAIAVLAVAAVGHPGSLEWIRTRSRSVVLTSLVALAVLGGIVTASGVFQVAEATVKGTDPSAAGRVTSISKGVGASLRNPLGLGLGTAGPRAYAIDPTAVRTESWYIVATVELGWAGAALLAATLLSLSRDLIRGWRQKMADAVPATAAWFGALSGALVIPALFDLPASIPLFVLVGLASVPALAGGSAVIERTSVPDLSPQDSPARRPSPELRG